MGDFLATIFVEILINFVFSFPGAVIRWIFSNHKKSVREIWKEDIYNNAAIGLVFLVIVIAIIAFLRS